MRLDRGILSCARVYLSHWKPLARIQCPAYFVGVSVIADDSVNRSISDKPGLRLLNWAFLLQALIFASSANAATAPSGGSDKVTTPTTPLEFFNQGTKQLSAGKLREAESFFESVLASQKEPLQIPALYNLGHVRFDQGIEELKKGPAAEKTAARARAATDQASGAIRSIDDALASEEVGKMVAAYQHGRGVRKELKAATEAVQKALEVCGTVLARWQRASGDFKSAVELKPAERDAQENAEVVDRYIAKLVDSVRELQKCNKGLCDKKDELGQKMKALKGRIPAPNMPPGAAGEDEEEEEFQLGKEPGQKEGASRDGQEILLSPELAGWLLQGFKLDYDRRLPMMRATQGKPTDRSGPTW